MSTDNSVLNRTILVRGFEGNEQDLLRTIQKYGRVEDMNIKRCNAKKRECAPFLDVGSFIGKPSKFERGSNKISDPCGTTSSQAVGHNGKKDKIGIVDPRARQKALHCCQSVILKDLSSAQLSTLSNDSFVVSLQPQQELFVQGEDIKYLYILVSGILRIFAKFPVTCCSRLSQFVSSVFSPVLSNFLLTFAPSTRAHIRTSIKLQCRGQRFYTKMRSSWERSRAPAS
jgi:hypothetical protein